MTIVYLALGSNVGDSPTLLAEATRTLREKLVNVKQAPVYRSKAVGYTDQPDFYNTAVSAETDLSPSELLTYVKGVEKNLGRVHRFRWGPREIDIDIIFYGNETRETPELTIPHPRFMERDFVLKPLQDLNPTLIDPRSGQSVSKLLSALPPDQLSVKAPV